MNFILLSHMGETEINARKDKEHDRDIRFARPKTSAVSEHTNEKGNIPIGSKVKFIDPDPHWCTCGVNEAIHVRLHPNNINRDSEIEIPKA